jgi:CheY-like chemotaxis protein
MSHILVIEDNENNARLVRKLLERAGHQVTHTDSGEDGLNSVFNQPPDLVLADLGLPDIDGQTVIAMIRQQPLLKDLPIVIFTAWPQETAYEMANAYGCNGVILKPIDTRAFVDEINRHLAPQA